MKRTLLIIVVLICQTYLYSQNDLNTKSFLEKVLYPNLTPSNIIVGNLNIDYLPLNEYKLVKSYKDFDINIDIKKDLILLIEQDFRKVKSYRAQEAFTKKIRILLILELTNSENYKLTKIITKALNQRTEGLYGDLKIFFNSDNNLVLRENGRQIDTNWVTDLIFKSDSFKTEWILKEAKSYSANINNNGIEIEKTIEVIKAKEKVSLDSVNYYNYFPFGFTDNIPANR